MFLIIFNDFKLPQNIFRLRIRHFRYVTKAFIFIVGCTGARGTDHPPFSNFLFTNLFSIKFLCISLLFHLFFLILTCSCQYSYNLMLTSNCMCRHINNPQGMQLGRFKRRTPARFEYIYCTLFPLCHSN